jgi:hypothetical protein
MKRRKPVSQSVYSIELSCEDNAPGEDESGAYTQYFSVDFQKSDLRYELWILSIVWYDLHLLFVPFQNESTRIRSHLGGSLVTILAHYYNCICTPQSNQTSNQTK